MSKEKRLYTAEVDTGAHRRPPQGRGQEWECSECGDTLGVIGGNLTIFASVDELRYMEIGGTFVVHVDTAGTLRVLGPAVGAQPVLESGLLVGFVDDSEEWQRGKEEPWAIAGMPDPSRLREALRRVRDELAEGEEVASS